MKKKQSLNIIILKYFSILVLITMAAAAASFYYGTTKIVLEYSDNVTKQLTDKIINRTTSYLNAPALQSRVVSQLVSSPNIMDNHEQLWRYMWEQMNVLPQVQSIFIADTFGNYVQVRREPELATRYINHTDESVTEKWLFRDNNYNILGEKTKNSVFDPRRRPWYKNTFETQKVYWTDIYLFTTAQTPGISATFPVLDQDGKKMAVVGINSPLHSLSDFLSKQEVSENGLVFITNTNHEIIAFPDTSLLTTILPNSGIRRMALVYELPQKWLRDAYDHYRSTMEKRFVSTTNNQRYITNVVAFPKSFPSEWQIFVVIPEEDVLGSVNKVFFQTLAVFGGIFLVSLLIVHFFSLRITRPIKQLSLETQKIKNFDLDDVVKVDTNIKEIDLMSQSIVSATTGLQSFKKYVPAELVKQLVELGEEAHVGGKETELTLLFTDIAGFTTIAESMHPEDLTLHLSQYFEELSHIIMLENGTIDKYIGDAIMAFWGAPLAQKNTPYSACKAALNCQKKNQELNAVWAEERKPILQTRIGLHTGRTVVGNMGSNERINYTVLGDSVNLAARLEGINKLYGTSIIISETTFYQVSNDFFCRLLDIVAVKGKTKGVQIYELICEKDNIPNDLPKPLDYYENYEKAFSAYLNQQWSEALNILNSLLEYDAHDKAVLLMIARCNHYNEHQSELPDDWDGTTVLTSK
ncbi:MAG: hypothetical protein OQL19_00395 [Gammaproteobacteria bacterium]|nr:hypothetical protein [Gammaproteobacteria bacterium]